MAIIKPLRGVRYNKGAVKDLAKVVAPPYDIIPPRMQDELYRLHEYNVVRLILNKIKESDTAAENRYTRAGRFLSDWMDKNILIHDDRPAIYIYSQTYGEKDKTIERIGFIALMSLNIGGKDEVLPHENTLLAPKRDRLELIRSTRANLSPIFVLYDDPSHLVLRSMKKCASGHKPAIDIVFEDVRNRVWPVTDDAMIKKIVALMKKKEIFIADGHHRYEVARTYGLEVQSQDLPDELKERARSVMAYFCESDKRSLMILPTHRLIKDIGRLTEAAIIERLKSGFAVREVKSLKALLSGLDTLRARANAFGMCIGPRYYLLRLEDTETASGAIKGASDSLRHLDVAILHSFIICHLLGITDDDANIEYTKDPVEVRKGVSSGKYALGFILNPTKVADVQKIAKLGEKMPKKATYFYPKPLSGLVINKLG